MTFSTRNAAFALAGALARAQPGGACPRRRRGARRRSRLRLRPWRLEDPHHPARPSADRVGRNDALTGTVTVRKVWDGAASWRRSRRNGRKAIGRDDRLPLRSQARQWSMNFANSSAGKFNPR